MTHSHRVIRCALASLVAVGLGAANAVAAAPVQEKCAGVIKAGKNDCATSMNACHGHVTVDSHKEAWIYVPKGTCNKIVGAYLTTQIDPTPGVKN